MKRAAVRIIPTRQNANATKCCCQPRGLISLARVALIITCHYQFWLHLLTGLSGFVYCTLQCTGWCVSVCILETWAQLLNNVKSKSKVHYGLYNNRVFVHTLVERESCLRCILIIAVDCTQDSCINGAYLSVVHLCRCTVKAKGSSVKLHCE